MFRVQTENTVDNDTKVTAQATLVQPIDASGETAKTGTKVNGNRIATAEKLHDIVSQSYRSLKTNIPLWRQALSLYIANGETENILFSPVKVCVKLHHFVDNINILWFQKKVIDTFAQLRFIVSSQYTEEEQQIIVCPSNEQLNLLFSSMWSFICYNFTFTNFCDNSAVGLLSVLYKTYFGVIFRNIRII